MIITVSVPSSAEDVNAILAKVSTAELYKPDDEEEEALLLGPNHVDDAITRTREDLV